jgi:hypothetical protein
MPNTKNIFRDNQDVQINSENVASGVLRLVMMAFCQVSLIGKNLCLSPITPSAYDFKIQ